MNRAVRLLVLWTFLDVVIIWELGAFRPETSWGWILLLTSLSVR